MTRSRIFVNRRSGQDRRQAEAPPATSRAPIPRRNRHNRRAARTLAEDYYAYQAQTPDDGRFPTVCESDIPE